MKTTRQIRVLVVDDSIMFREIISRGISSDANIKVVAKATDPFDARDKIIEFLPDVMICDVQMPKMDGIEFIRQLLPQYKLPVIVVTTISNAVFDAMNAGAVDFVVKPNVKTLKDVESFIFELIKKVKIAANAKVSLPAEKDKAVNNTRLKDSDYKIIAIGASTGGTEAIFDVLKKLPDGIPGIVVVQHIPPHFSAMYAERLDKQLPMHIKEAQTGDVIEPGKVLIAPGDKHMRIKKRGIRFVVECFQGEPVNGHCPSVDVLFESVAREAGNKAVGVILTGMGYDGAKGLLNMRRRGARTIGQDEKSSVVYGMPKVAFDIGAVEKQVGLKDIPRTICSFIESER